MKSYAMLKVGMELHLAFSLALPFFLASYQEGEFTMKLSNMRKKEMLDFYLLLDIQRPLLRQQLMLYAQWRYNWFLQLTALCHQSINVILIDWVWFFEWPTAKGLSIFPPFQKIWFLQRFHGIILLTIQLVILQWYWLMALKSQISDEGPFSIRIWRWNGYLIQVCSWKLTHKFDNSFLPGFLVSQHE